MPALVKGVEMHKKNFRSPEFKKKVALAAIREHVTINEIAQEYSVHPMQVRQWKKELLDKAQNVFDKGKKKKDPEAIVSTLYEQIGKLTVENDWLKKNGALTMIEKTIFLDPIDEIFSIRKQAGLLGIPRSSYYYKPAREKPENLLMMDLVDKVYAQHPYYGSRRILAYLIQQGYKINRKRVQRLISIMGLIAISPKRNLSKPRKDFKKYPYLLSIERVGYPISQPSLVDRHYVYKDKRRVYVSDCCN